MKINTQDPSFLANSALLLFQFVVHELQPGLREEQLTPAQLELLLFIGGQEDAPSMTDIARHSAHSTASSTGTIDRLEKLDLVERFFQSDDRRKVLVRLKQKGKDFIISMKRRLTTKLGVSSNERQVLQDTLVALAPA